MRRERRAANIQKMKRTFQRIELGIDELILRGFPAADRYLIGDALTHELGRLFEGDVSLSRETHIPALDAGRIMLPSNARPASVGTQVAQAVHGSLNRNEGGARR